MGVFALCCGIQRWHNGNMAEPVQRLSRSHTGWSNFDVLQHSKIKFFFCNYCWGLSDSWGDHVVVYLHFRSQNSPTVDFQNRMDVLGGSVQIYWLNFTSGIAIHQLKASCAVSQLVPFQQQTFQLGTLKPHGTQLGCCLTLGRWAGDGSWSTSAPLSSVKIVLREADSSVHSLEGTQTRMRIRPSCLFVA